MESEKDENGKVFGHHWKQKLGAIPNSSPATKVVSPMGELLSFTRLQRGVASRTRLLFPPRVQ